MTIEKFKEILESHYPDLAFEQGISERDYYYPKWHKREVEHLVIRHNDKNNTWFTVYEYDTETYEESFDTYQLSYYANDFRDYVVVVEKDIDVFLKRIKKEWYDEFINIPGEQLTLF